MASWGWYLPPGCTDAAETYSVWCKCACGFGWYAVMSEECGQSDWADGEDGLCPDCGAEPIVVKREDPERDYDMDA